MSSRPSPEKNHKGKSFLNDPECISLRDKLLQEYDISGVEYEALGHLAVHLREYEHQLALDEKYVEARQINNLSNQVRSDLTNNHNLSHFSSSNSLLNKSGHKSSENLKSQSADETLESRLQQYDQETEQKRKYMLTRNEQNLERFDKYWAEEMPNKYRKPSQNLLSRKMAEKTLAKSGDYENALIIHKEIDELAQKEADIAQENLRKDYKAAKEHLLSKQQNEMNVFDINRYRGRQLLISQFETQKVIQDKRKKILELRKRDNDLSKSLPSSYYSFSYSNQN